MASLTIKKVLEVPSTLEPNTLYLIRGSSDRSLTMTLTDKDGVIGYSTRVRRDPDLGNGLHLYLTGLNADSQLGTGNNISRSSPVQTVVTNTVWNDISVGTSHTAAIRTDRSLWLWGLNSTGQLGSNNRMTQSIPTQVTTNSTDWRYVSCGQHYSGAIKTDGSLWLWGRNAEGQLGTNNRTHRSSPVQTVSNGTNWSDISCGVTHTAAIKTDGSLWLWGANGDGQLGTNNRTNRSSPVQTISPTQDWQSVSLGNIHTAAIKTDGSLWLWGSNSFGQLGDGTYTRRSSPVQSIDASNNWTDVSCGYTHTAAIKTDGSLWLWGNNANGQLGIMSTTAALTPVQTIATGHNWLQVSSGHYHTAAIKTDGSLWAWGQGTSGQLGDGQRIARSSPVQVMINESKWFRVSCGGSHTGILMKPLGR